MIYYCTLATTNWPCDNNILKCLQTTVNQNRFYCAINQSNNQSLFQASLATESKLPVDDFLSKVCAYNNV